MRHAHDLWRPPGLELEGSWIVFDVTAQTLSLDVSFGQRDRDDI
jgi:hypothetical protein